jgi:hypothetical protein
LTLVTKHFVPHRRTFRVDKRKSFRVQSPRLAVLQQHVSFCITNYSVRFSCKCHVATVVKQVRKYVSTFLESRVVQEYLILAISRPNSQGSTNVTSVHQSEKIIMVVRISQSNPSSCNSSSLTYLQSKTYRIYCFLYTTGISFLRQIVPLFTRTVSRDSRRLSDHSYFSLP